MEEADRARLRVLIPQVMDLLAAIASGQRQPWEPGVAEEYLALHLETRAILAKDTAPCLCPWPNIHAWANGPATQDGWREILAQRARAPRLLCGLDVPPPWTLVDYYRDDDPDDTPFWSEFVASLSQQRKDILIERLNEELAQEGTTLYRDWTKAHKMPCSGTRGNKVDVGMYKIRQGVAGSEVLLRVFFATAGAGFRLVLLHGYDKTSDTSDAREAAETKIACDRLSRLA